MHKDFLFPSIEVASSQSANSTDHVEVAASTTQVAQTNNPSSEGFGSPDVIDVVLLAILIFVIYPWLKKRGRHTRVAEMARRAQKWIEGATEKHAISIPATGGVIIPKDETSLLGERSTMFELHADSTRHYLGTGGKIGSFPIYMGTSHSTSRKVLGKVGDGTAVLTNKTFMLCITIAHRSTQKWGDSFSGADIRFRGPWLQ